MRMRAKLGIGTAFAALLTISSAGANEVQVVSDVRGPEGPLVVDGVLYYVSWISSTVSKWDGKDTTLLNTTSDCGSNGLALTGRGTLLVACDSPKGAILELERSGRQLRRWDVDNQGRAFDGGINDVVVGANGSAYATLSGPDADPPGALMGRIFYLPPRATQWIKVAEDLNFANGIAISPDQKTLYVCETVGNSIKKFTINSDGTLSNRSNFAQLNLLVEDRVKSWFLGPDSMKVDRHGNVYVAQWLGAKVLKISPEGKLLHVFRIDAGEGTTNVALDHGEKDLYVTVVKDAKDPQARGSIVKIQNAD